MRQAIVTFDLGRVPMLSLDQEAFVHRLMVALMNTSRHHEIEHRGLPIATIDWVGQSEDRPITLVNSFSSDPQKILLDKIQATRDLILEICKEFELQLESESDPTNILRNKITSITQCGSVFSNLAESLLK